MAKQEASSTFHSAFYPLSISSILRKSIKILNPNDSLLLRSILLPFLPPLYAAVILHRLLAGPLIGRVEDAFESSSLTLYSKDLILLGAIEIPFFIFFSLVSLILMALSVHASAASSSDQRSSSTRTKLSQQIKSISWKRLISTSISVAAFTVIYLITLKISVQFASNCCTHAAFTTSIAAAGRILLVAAAAVFYIYLCAVWTVGLVVCVVEKDGECSNGLVAILEAEKVMRGRKIQGFLLTLMLALLSIPVYVIFYLTLTDDDDELGLMVHCAFGLVMGSLSCIFEVFTFVVFTVFYYDCQESRAGAGEERFDIVELESSNRYCSVSTAADV
ncbi:hypothetical protein Ancab_029260 [Ancistrocladus abbreviatus]